MSLAERIIAADAESVRLKDLLVEATEALEAAPEEDALVEQVNELTIQVEKQENMLSSLRKAEKALALRAAPVEGSETVEGGRSAAYAPNLKNFKDIKKGGELLWKHATAKIIAYVEKKPVQQVIEERYSDDQRVKASYDYTQAIQKSAVAPAMTTVPAWAGALVREDTRAFMEAITEVSVVAALANRVESFDFGGANSVKIPYENPLASNPTEPAWVGEGGVIPLTSFSFGTLTLSPYKLAAITTMSREIVDRSTPAIEGVVQNLLRKAYAKVVDLAFLNPNIAAVPNVRPASPFYGVTPVDASDFGTSDENIRGDILALLSALAAAGLGNNPVLIGNNLDFLGAGMVVNAMGEFMYKDEINGGNLLGIPIIGSGHVPAHRLAMLDADYIAMALGGIDFDVSDVATVTEANADATAPTQAGAGPGGGALGTAGQVPVSGGIPVGGAAGASTTGYTARSLWQTYSLGIRMVSHLSWGKTNPAAAQFISATDWAPPPLVP